MKLLIFILTISFAAASALAQKPITIVLVRHAEKDYTNPKDPNPSLNPVGKERAKLLEKAVRKYKVQAAYTTDFTRTRDTIAPIVAKRKIPVTVYNPKDLESLAKELKGLKTQRRVIVAGHSNTTPRVVNLLIGEQRFPDQPDSEYHKIFVVKIKDGKATVEVFDY